MGYSFFETIDLAPADPIFKLTTEFEEDRRPNKVNLSVGLYRDEQLQTPVLKTVKQAEKYLLDTEKSKEYLPISGNPVFVEETKRLIFGDVNRVCGIQTPGGTGALRVAGDFIRDENPKTRRKSYNADEFIGRTTQEPHVQIVDYELGDCLVVATDGLASLFLSLTERNIDPRAFLRDRIARRDWKTSCDPVINTDIRRSPTAGAWHYSDDATIGVIRV